MTDNYLFSAGKGAKQSTRIKQREAESFEAFSRVVCGELAQKNREPLAEHSLHASENTALKNASMWFAAGYQNGRRTKALTLPRRFVVLDIDKCSKENRSRVFTFCERYKSFIYPSFSSTNEAPRLRVVFDASRPILPEEQQSVTDYIAGALTEHIRAIDPGAVNEDYFEIDHRSGEASRIFYAPTPKGGKEVKLYDGAPLNVDEIISLYPAGPTEGETRDRRQRKHGTESTSTENIATPFLDPIPEILKERGLLKKQKAPGVWTCICPWDSEHTQADGGAGDSSCEYCEALTGEHRDGGAFKYGRFICQHAHCKERTPESFFAGLGLSYSEYVKFIDLQRESEFTSATSGVTYIKKRSKIYAKYAVGKKAEMHERPICGAITIKARLADVQGRESSLLLEWTNKHTHAPIQQDVLEGRLVGSGASTDIVQTLVNGGLAIDFHATLHGQSPIVDYLRSYPLWGVPAKVRAARVGWFNLPKEYGTAEIRRVFITSTGNYGEEADKVYYAGSNDGPLSLSTRGSLTEWRENVASMGRLSSRVAFAIACAFAAPCLRMRGLEGGAFNLSGRSSKGKTTAQRAGASVYGNPQTGVKPWNSTGAAIEVVANGHNDLLLCLDEAGTADARTLGDTIYRLSNGLPKGRGRVDAERGGAIVLREILEPWHVLTLSASELTAAQLMQSLGRKTITGGQQVRLVDIPAEADKAHPERGIFESIGAFADTKAAADSLNTATASFYGVAGREWLEHLSKHYADAKEALARYCEAFIILFKEEVGTPKATQALRALDRFAVVAAAGALSSERGLTGWSVDEALRAILECARAALVGHLNDDTEEVNAAEKLLRVVTVNAAKFDTFSAGGFRLEEATGGDCYGLHYFEKKNVGLTEEPAAPVDLTDTMSEEERRRDCVEYFLVNADIFKDTVSPLSWSAASEFFERIGAIPDTRLLPGKRERQAHGIARLRRGGKSYSGYLIIKQKLEDFVSQNRG